MLEKNVLYAALSDKYNIEFVDRLLEIEQADVYFMGGVVRDLLQNKPYKDADMRVVLPLDFEQRERLIEKALQGIEIKQKIVLKDIDLLVYRFLPAGSKTTYPVDLSVVSDISNNPPDFSVNGIYYDARAGEIVDNYNGVADLTDGIVRSCSDPDKEFSEQNNEVFRAVKAVCKDDMTIEPVTLKSLQRFGKNTIVVFEYLNDVRDVSLMETFHSDLFGGIIYNPKRYFDLLADWAVISTLMTHLASNIKRPVLQDVGNPFSADFKGSIEMCIAMFVSSLAKGFSTDNTQLPSIFNEIKQVLALDEMADYTDLVVDAKQLNFIA